MSSLVAEFINIRNWAVVGASMDPSKFGCKIFQDLTKAGYRVFGINPKGGSIGNHQFLTDLSQLSQHKVNFSDVVVDVVVPPSATESVVKACKDLGITRVWMQPGSQSPAAVQFCHSNGIKVIHQGECAMVEKKIWPNDSAKF